MSYNPFAAAFSAAVPLTPRSSRSVTGADPLAARGPDDLDPFEVTPFDRALSIAGAGIGAFHGYRRNDSVGWAIGWALLGGMFPVITTAVALAQGIGKKG